MKQDFIQHTYQGGRQTLPSGALSIAKTGRIGFSRQLAADLKLERDVRARLYWSDVTKKVAMFFTDEDDRTAFPTGSANGKVAYVSAERFFRGRGIDALEHAGHHRYEIIDAASIGVGEAGEKVVVFSLEGTA